MLVSVTCRTKERSYITNIFVKIHIYTLNYHHQSFLLTLVSVRRRWGGMPEATRCWSSPARSTPVPRPPWWLWPPGTAHSPPYWSLQRERRCYHNVVKTQFKFLELPECLFKLVLALVKMEVHLFCDWKLWLKICQILYPCQLCLST